MSAEYWKGVVSPLEVLNTISNVFCIGIYFYIVFQDRGEVCRWNHEGRAKTRLASMQTTRVSRCVRMKYVGQAPRPKTAVRTQNREKMFQRPTVSPLKRASTT